MNELGAPAALARSLNANFLRKWVLDTEHMIVTPVVEKSEPAHEQANFRRSSPA